MNTVPFHSRVADAFAPRQPAAIDSIPVIAEHLVAECLASSLRLEHSGEPLPELLATLPAFPAMASELQPHPFCRPAHMPHYSADHTPILKPSAGAVQTRSWPCITDRNPHLSARLLIIDKLVVG